MVIGIDIDDTICNTKDLQRIYWKEYYNSNPNLEYSEELPKEVNYFGIPYINDFWDLYRGKLFTPDIKDDCPVIIDKLISLGFTFVIVTSRPKENYQDLDKSLSDWLDRENIHVSKIYSGVRNKGEFCKDNNIDLLIDDDIRHINAANELSVKNIHFDDDMTWKQVYDLLIKYL